MEDVVHGMREFVDTVSSHEGAELPWSADSLGRVEFDTDTVLEMLGGEGEDSESGDSGSVEDGEVEEMREIMEQLDQELMSAGFKSSLDSDLGRGGEGEDVAMAHNLLSSLAAQPEAAGPTANILHSLGLPIPEPD